MGAAQKKPKQAFFDDEYDDEEVLIVEDVMANETYSDNPKSEPIPEVNDGNVKVIVGDNWNEIVNDTTRDVFVLYYSPVSDAKKVHQLIGLWKLLGKYVSPADDIVIAMMDCSKNTVKGLCFDVYPTLILYTKENKQGILYPAALQLFSLNNFLHDYSQSFRDF